MSARLFDGPLPPDELTILLIPICWAIAAASEHGVLHRDLKPSNILIDQTKCSLVADFRIAKNLQPESGITRTNATFGTPRHMGS